jgi:hypothetical protein
MASGRAGTAGVLIATSASLLPGNAVASVGAAGAVLDAHALIIPGTARGHTGAPEVPSSAWQFGGVSVPIDRRKQTSRPGRAAGATLGAQAALIPGTARGAAGAIGCVINAPGALLYWHARSWTEEHKAELKREEDELLQLLGILPMTLADGTTVFLAEF